MERIKPQPKKPPCCMASSWHDCLVAMNKSDDQVRMLRASIDDVVACHQQTGASVSRDLILRDGRKYVKVNRALLWNLVQEHGKVCPDD